MARSTKILCVCNLSRETSEPSDPGAKMAEPASAFSLDTRLELALTQGRRLLYELTEMNDIQEAIT